jgi:hypothetical protein
MRIHALVLFGASLALGLLTTLAPVSAGDLSNPASFTEKAPATYKVKFDTSKGSFVVEVLVPGLRRLPPGETFQPFDVSPTHLGFDEYDIAQQGLVSHHYWIADGKVEVFSPPFRYVWPAELDLMAQLAGMTLRERWRGWKREPFTSDSSQHVSVWEKPGDPSAA